VSGPLRARDRFCYAEVFYAGGTVARDVSSAALAADLPGSIGCAAAGTQSSAALTGAIYP